MIQEPTPISSRSVLSRESVIFNIVLEKLPRRFGRTCRQLTIGEIPTLANVATALDGGGLTLPTTCGNGTIEAGET